MDAEVLRRWREREVFRRSLKQTEDGPLFSFYDGPPTANGRPGVHHVEARVFKDVIPRYLTMKGYHVPRKAGWDCHGIPVELEAEKTLGISSKREIEELGVVRFNTLCRESVTRYVEDWKRLTDRIGFWVDMEDPYWTMSTSYIESVWWSLKKFFDQGLLYEDYRVVPYCPRCGTSLSDHEVAQGYDRTADLSVVVRFPLLSGPLAPGGEGAGAEGASLLVWTTMPWTVIFTTLVAVSDSVRYVLARGGRAAGHLVVLAADRVADVLGEGAEVLRDVALKELVGARYQGPFDFVGPGSAEDRDGDPASWRYVVVSDWVDTDQGTGLVSTAAAFGEDDLRVARENGAPVINRVDLEGRFEISVGPYGGRYVRDCDADVVEDIRRSDLLIQAAYYEHTFPFCWRCRSPLIYYAKLAWYLSTTRFRDRLLDGNAIVDWRPAHIRDGRYGDWLANNVDWALSRERYWGTPLPMWRCGQCAHTVAVGSRAELGELAGADLSGLDPHRPYVDEITAPCQKCEGGVLRRVPEVLDAWYDSGSMPFAQFGYPHVPGSEERFRSTFPADYTAEAVDQTRGWWYSLQAIATGLFDKNAYLRAVCLGHIVDANGRKMSKSLGNVIDPWTLLDRHGADALRWLLLCEGNPWQSRRVGEDPLVQVTRKLFLTLWNTYHFFVLYANIVGWSPRVESPPVASRPTMDRYILAELADTIDKVDGHLTDFDITQAGRRIAEFVDDLSNWYVRRCRERFWKTGAQEAHSEAAFATLHTCLTTLAGLLAPFAPFLADELHERLVRSVTPDAPDSIHLAAFPAADPGIRDEELRQAMKLARQLTTLGRDARAAGAVPVRFPLRRAVVTVPARSRHLFDLVSDVIAKELNVKSIGLADEGHAGGVAQRLKPNFRALGPIHGKSTPHVAKAIERVDADKAIAHLLEHGWFSVMVDGRAARVVTDCVQVIKEPLTGWQVSSDGEFSLAVDLAMDRELRLEGMARECVRAINELRKRQDLQVTDRVDLRLKVGEDTGGEIAAMLNVYTEDIAQGVIAATVRHDDTLGDEGEKVSIGDGFLFLAVEVTTGDPNGMALSGSAD
jgi:isoleucyl-tRNA synthetase